MTCTYRMVLQPTILISQRVETKTHPPDNWALEGTIENLIKVDEFLKQKEISGYLFAGCLSKRLPRKDIDVFLDYVLEDSLDKGYKTLGVDWWFNQDWRSIPTGRNVNGIETELGEYKVHYKRKERGGLLLPNYYIEKRPKSKIVRVLYSEENLKGGDDQNALKN